jgi:hypothetical protein
MRLFIFSLVNRSNENPNKRAVYLQSSYQKATKHRNNKLSISSALSMMLVERKRGPRQNEKSGYAA